MNRDESLYVLWSSGTGMCYYQNKLFVDSVVIGLYLLQSCINHSCDPNAEVTFNSLDSELSLIATRDIVVIHSRLLLLLLFSHSLVINLVD